MTLLNPDGSVQCICHEHKPVCDCLATVLSDDQIRFVRLHQLAIGGSEYVEEWRHLFSGATVRARTNRGRTACCPKEEVDGLVAAGLMTIGYGGSFYLTDAGRKI